MAAHQIGLALIGVAAGLEVRIRSVEREFAVLGFVDIVDLQRQQAAFLVQKEFGIVGGGLEGRLHELEEFLRLIEFRGGQACPDPVQKFRNFLVRHHRAFVNQVAHKGGIKAGLHRVKIVLVADPERHLTVEGDGRFLQIGMAALGGGGARAYGQGRAALTLQQHIKTEARVIQIGLELEGKGRALDAAGLVRIHPEQVIFLAHGPEKPGGQPVGNFHPVAVIIKMLADLTGHMRQLGRKFGPGRIVDDLFQRHFVVHAGQAGLVLSAPEKGDQQPPLFRREAEDQVVAAGLRLHIRGEEVPEALLPVRDRGGDFLRIALFLAQFFNKAQGQGPHMPADAGKGVRTVALVARAAVRDGETQARRVDLKILALNHALHVPGLAFLDIYFLHPALGQDIVGGVADILRHAVMQKSLAHFADDALF